MGLQDRDYMEERHSPYEASSQKINYSVPTQKKHLKINNNNLKSAMTWLLILGAYFIFVHYTLSINPLHYFDKKPLTKQLHIKQPDIKPHKEHRIKQQDTKPPPGDKNRLTGITKAN